MEILDDVNTVPDTETPNNDSDVSADESDVEAVLVGATQPLTLTPHAPQELTPATVFARLTLLICVTKVPAKHT